MKIVNQDRDKTYTMDENTQIYYRTKWHKETFLGFNVYGKGLIKKDKRLKTEIMLGTYDDENEAVCVVREITNFFKIGKFNKYTLPESADIEEFEIAERG